jgi:hypothetical protein
LYIVKLTPIVKSNNTTKVAKEVFRGVNLTNLPREILGISS